MACELPREHGVPLSGFSCSELHRFVIERGVSEASASTIGRWLAEDAIKPWQQRSWIFPRDPDFLENAGRVLDLYQGRWEGKLLEPGDCVLGADAKPSIQARRRIHESAPPAPGRASARRARVRAHGRDLLSRRLGRAPRWRDRTQRAQGRHRALRPARLAGHDLRAYASAPRVFWIVDNGSDHRGQTSIDRLEGRWRKLILIHLPVHASWLNQVEIYHSIIQRKLLDPNDFGSIAELARALNEFERHYNEIAQPLEWNFTRQDLAELLERLDEPAPNQRVPLALAA